MTDVRMNNDDRERGVSASGPEAQAYYERAMKEARTILDSSRRGYFASRRRVAFQARDERK